MIMYCTRTRTSLLNTEFLLQRCSDLVGSMFIDTFFLLWQWVNDWLYRVAMCTSANLFEIFFMISRPGMFRYPDGLEVFWEPLGRRPDFTLRRGEFRHWQRPCPVRLCCGSWIIGSMVKPELGFMMIPYPQAGVLEDQTVNKFKLKKFQYGIVLIKISKNFF